MVAFARGSVLAQAPLIDSKRPTPVVNCVRFIHSAGVPARLRGAYLFLCAVLLAIIRASGSCVIHVSPQSLPAVSSQ